jgi:hypothetical protein
MIGQIAVIACILLAVIAILIRCGLSKDCQEDSHIYVDAEERARQDWEFYQVGINRAKSNTE